MSVTSKLKRGVDLPIWEWTRPLPVATLAANPSTFATGGKPDGRYVYYLAGLATGSFRYDTWTDGWTSITTSPQSQGVVSSTRYNDYHGYSGRVISGSSNGFTAAVPKGNKCVGKKVRIVSGTGAGQVRTITAVSDPTIHDTIVASTNSTTSIVDATKSYGLNQWRDYGLRIVTNTSSDFRKIIYNSTTTVVFADNTFSSVALPWAYSPLPFTPTFAAGTEMRAQIESYGITVDSAWTTAPDNTSVFVVQSGMLWNVNVSSNRFALQSYDVLNDNWYQNTSVGGGLLNGNLATDVAIETLNESAVGVLVSADVVSATNNTVTLDATIANGQYDNYIVRIVSGTGAGQDRLITSSVGAAITVNRKWDVNPDNTSVAEIIADNDKIYMVGNASAGVLEYDSLNDVWSDRRILEVGCPSNLCATWAGFKRPIAISTITRTGTTATVTTVNGAHGLKTGDVVTISGATNALYNIQTSITVTGANTFTYTMASDPGANAAASATQSVTQLVDPSKSWNADEHIGKILTFSTTAYTATGGFQATYYHRVITGNTATTLTFASGTAPTAGTTFYMITDARSHGGIFTSQLTGTPSTTVLPVATSIIAGNTGTYAGLRAIIIDGANWAEASIDTNTTTSITLSAALGFTPTTAAIVTVVGVTSTGAGCSLEYLYNTSLKQKGKYMFGTRGGATNYMYLYDITTNQWEILNQMPNSETFSQGSMTAYDGDDRVYIQRDATGRVLYYDFTDNNLYSYNQIPYGMGAATLGNKMSIVKTEDGLKFLYIPRHTGSEFWRSLIWI